MVSRSSRLLLWAPPRVLECGPPRGCFGSPSCRRGRTFGVGTPVRYGARSSLFFECFAMSWELAPNRTLCVRFESIRLDLVEQLGAAMDAALTGRPAAG